MSPGLQPPKPPSITAVSRAMPCHHRGGYSPGAPAAPAVQADPGGQRGQSGVKHCRTGGRGGGCPHTHLQSCPPHGPRLPFGSRKTLQEERAGGRCALCPPPPAPSASSATELSLLPSGGAEGGLLFVPKAHHRVWYSRLSLASLEAHPDPGLRAPLWHPLKEKRRWGGGIKRSSSQRGETSGSARHRYSPGSRGLRERLCHPVGREEGYKWGLSPCGCSG